MVNVERATIASMVSNRDNLERGMQEIVIEDYSDPFCARLFGVIKSIHASGDAVDMVTVSSFLNPEEVNQFVDLTTGEFLESAFGTYVSKLKDCRKRRELKAAAEVVAGLCDDTDVDVYEKAQSLLDNVNSLSSGSINRLSSEEIINIVSEMSDVAKHGTPTGFPLLDKFTGGLQKGSLIVVAGRPSMGKSTFAMNVATNILMKEGVVAFFTLEDNRNALIHRMASYIGKFSERELKGGSREAAKNAFVATQYLRAFKMYVVDNGVQSVQSISSACYRIHSKEQRLDLVVIDYLGLLKTVQSRNKSRQQELGEVTRALKILAKQLDTSIILVSQLNRESDKRGDKRPIMSDLRESGDIEQDADLILFPYRPYVNDETADPKDAELIIGKNRNGQTGKTAMKWNGEYFTFSQQDGNLPEGW